MSQLWRGNSVGHLSLNMLDGSLASRGLFPAQLNIWELETVEELFFSKNSLSREAYLKLSFFPRGR
jgi:hypothetical protein